MAEIVTASMTDFQIKLTKMIEEFANCKRDFFLTENENELGLQMDKLINSRYELYKFIRENVTQNSDNRQCP